MTELAKTPIETLSASLKAHGPGILAVNDKEIGGHEIVLDDISLESGTATIRDPFRLANRHRIEPIG